MKIECSKPQISNYDFLRLLLSTMIMQNYGVIIEKYALEKKLYDFYGNPDFIFLFEDLGKKESIDNNYVDLGVAVQTALTFGLLIIVQSNNNLRFKIEITEEEALSIISEFNPDEVIAMKRLCDFLNANKESNMLLTKKKPTKKKKVTF